MSCKSRAKLPRLFLRLNSLAEFIRLVVQLYIRFSLSLRMIAVRQILHARLCEASNVPDVILNSILHKQDRNRTAPLDQLHSSASKQLSQPGHIGYHGHSLHQITCAIESLVPLSLSAIENYMDRKLGTT